MISKYISLNYQVIFRFIRFVMIIVITLRTIVMYTRIPPGPYRLFQGVFDRFCYKFYFSFISYKTMLKKAYQIDVLVISSKSCPWGLFNIYGVVWLRDSTIDMFLTTSVIFISYSLPSLKHLLQQAPTSFKGQFSL